MPGQQQAMARVPASMPAVDRLGISAFRKMVIPMGIRQNTATYTFMPQIHSNSASGQDRAALINFFGRDTAIHHINNWMGDEEKIIQMSRGELDVARVLLMPNGEI